MNKLLVIIGPTAVGKSDLAISVAKKYDGEIISADSRQVYRELNLGTGKVKKDNTDDLFLSSGIIHHGIDIVDVQKQYSIAEFQKYCNKKIKEIWLKNKLPIICGGSPLYVISVLEGWKFPKIKPDLKLRSELDNFNIEELYAKLYKLDPDRAKSIDKKNKRRLIRALEIVMKNDIVEPLIKKPIQADILILGIKKERSEIKDLILKRLNRRIKDGMIEEVRQLKERGITSERLDDLGLEYRYINMYLDNKISLNIMKEQLYNKICQFAKRQMTWFKKFNNVWWLDKKDMIFKIQNWLKN